MRLVGFFALGLVVLDALEIAAASSYERCARRAIDGHAAAPDALSHLDLLATVSELTALGLVSSTLFVAVLSAAFAARSSRSARRVGWQSAWPLVAVIALSTSSSLAPAPDEPMQAPASPASLGASDDFEPLIRAGDDRVDLDPLDFSGTASGIGLLTARGELQTAGGRLTLRRAPAGDFNYPGRPIEWMTAELLVDRRATLAQLMDVAHALRAFEEIAVGFRVRPELDDSPRARARWGFLELASRAIAGRRIALVEPQSCGETIEIAGARYTDCIDDDGQEARVLRDADALTLAQWLDTPLRARRLDRDRGHSTRPDASLLERARVAARSSAAHTPARPKLAALTLRRARGRARRTRRPTTPRTSVARELPILRPPTRSSERRREPLPQRGSAQGTLAPHRRPPIGTLVARHLALARILVGARAPRGVARSLNVDAQRGAGTIAG
jgi:hypothetical protein